MVDPLSYFSFQPVLLIPSEFITIFELWVIFVVLGFFGGDVCSYQGMHHEGGCINDILPSVVMTLFVFQVKSYVP